MAWKLRWISDMPGVSVKERRRRAQVKAASFREKGYKTKIARAKEGNRIVYNVFTRWDIWGKIRRKKQ